MLKPGLIYREYTGLRARYLNITRFGRHIMSGLFWSLEIAWSTCLTFIQAFEVKIKENCLT